MSDKRQVEFVVPTKIGYNSFEAGDRFSFPTEEANRYIGLGWAKCPETGEQGELKPGAVALNIHDTTTAQAAE
jgi:hypothetical protein